MCVFDSFFNSMNSGVVSKMVKRKLPVYSKLYNSYLSDQGHRDQEEALAKTERLAKLMISLYCLTVVIRISANRRICKIFSEYFRNLHF